MKNDIRFIRRWILFFMVSLFLSGLTAIPLETELRFLTRCFSPETSIGAWIDRVYISIVQLNRQFPYMAYGYDWLAFAHFMLTLLFIGPLRDPIRNIWVIEFGMICCVLVIPFALIAGPARDIPFGWQLIDCSFGVFGIIPLYLVRSRIKKMEELALQLTEDMSEDISQGLRSRPQRITGVRSPFRQKDYSI